MLTAGVRFKVQTRFAFSSRPIRQRTEFREPSHPSKITTVHYHIPLSSLNVTTRMIRLTWAPLGSHTPCYRIVSVVPEGREFVARDSIHQLLSINLTESLVLPTRCRLVLAFELG